jgi:DNA-binding transcriptional LysR family regulator
MDRTTSMATFVKVVDNGGFSAAARVLKMSPSMVTTHIQSLEERLGVRLLNRSTRRISLTEVGESYYERCRQILAELDDANRIAQALQSTPRGTLRLNTSVAIPPFLAPVITEYGGLYSEVSVSLTMTDRMVDLVEEGFDLAIRNMSVPDSSLIARRVGTYRLVVCGAPDYLARRGTPRQPADLSHHNCMIYSHSPWGGTWRFARPGGEQSVALSGNLQANSANALRLAAVQGQGLVMMPSFLVADDIKSGRLVPVLKEILQTEYDIQAIYPHRHHLSAKVRSFVDLLIEHYRKNPAWADPCRHAPDRQRQDAGVDIRRPATARHAVPAQPPPRQQTNAARAGDGPPDHVWGRRPDQIRGVISPE